MSCARKRLHRCLFTHVGQNRERKNKERDGFSKDPFQHPHFKQEEPKGQRRKALAKVTSSQDRLLYTHQASCLGGTEASLAPSSQCNRVPGITATCQSCYINLSSLNLSSFSLFVTKFQLMALKIWWYLPTEAWYCLTS